MYLILLYNIYSKRKTDFIMEIRMALDGWRMARNDRNKTSTTYSESNFTILLSVLIPTLSRWTYKHVLGEII